jgi:hypothetical protein
MLRLTTDATGYGGEGRLAQSAERDAWRVERGELSVSREALGVATADEPRRLLDAAPAQTVSMPPWTGALFSLASG